MVGHDVNSTSLFCESHCLSMYLRIVCGALTGLMYDIWNCKFKYVGDIDILAYDYCEASISRLLNLLYLY